MSNDRAPVVWHIDDNAGDLELVAIALREASRPIHLRSFSDAAIVLDELTVVGADATPTCCCST